jgi:hypothetical protein
VSPVEQHGFGVRYWEIIADNLKKRGWSLGYVSAFDSEGRTIWIADAHRDDGKRFVVHAEELLTAFLELERATRRFNSQALLLEPVAFEESDIFVRASGVNHDGGKLPTLRSLGIRLIE